MATHYPPVSHELDEYFGINPHVDTTFFTILAQDSPGLTIFGERSDTRLNVPVLEQGE